MKGLFHLSGARVLKLRENAMAARFTPFTEALWKRFHSITEMWD